MGTKREGRIVGLVLILGMLAAACGSGTSEETQAFCDEYIATVGAINMGPEDDPEAWVAQVSDGLETLKTTAPDAITAAANGMADALLTPISALDEDGFFAVTESDDYIADVDVINEFVTSDCDVGAIEVIAVDYAFEADLDGVEAGTTAFEFTNEGSEFHEMLLMKINDGVTESVEELLAMSEEESAELATFVGVSFAAPGASSTMFADLEDGRYVMLCFIPTGTTSMEDAETTDGAPHFMNGMVREFNIGA